MTAGAQSSGNASQPLSPSRAVFCRPACCELTRTGDYGVGIPARKSLEGFLLGFCSCCFRNRGCMVPVVAVCSTLEGLD